MSKTQRLVMVALMVKEVGNNSELSSVQIVNARIVTL
jgi:hypothetical protein